MDDSCRKQGSTASAARPRPVMELLFLEDLLRDLIKQRLDVGHPLEDVSYRSRMQFKSLI